MFNFPVVPVGRKPKTLPAFIVAGNGIFLRKETALGVTQTRVSNVAHLPELTPTLEYALPPIPKKLSAQIAGFLLKVDKVFNSEGALLLCLDKQQRWRIVVPRQDPSGADVRYFVDPDTVPDGWTLAGTVHSHPFNKTSTPSASWTDESDERKIDGVHLVAGSLEHNPKYGAAVVVNGTRFKYEQWEELITPAEPNMDLVPDEWLDKVEKKKSKISTFVSKVTGGGNSSYTSGYTYVPDYVPKEGETVEQAIARAREHSLKWVQESAGKLGYKFVWHLEELPEGPVTADDDNKAVTITDTVQVGTGGQQVATMSPTQVDGECACIVCECGITGTTSNLMLLNGVVTCTLCKEGNHGVKRKKKKKDKHGRTTVDTPSGPMTVTELVEDPQLPGLWREAMPIVCKGKHPEDPCKANCGCHCDPCKTKTVGAYNAADVNIPEYETDDKWGGMGRPPEDDECKCEECHGGCFAFLGLNHEALEKTLCDDCQRGSHYDEKGNVARVGYQNDLT